jgi:hypothetical protein
MWLSKAIRRSPPHLPIGCVAPKQRHHEDFDLAFDRGLDHQIVALAGEGDDVAADLAVGLVMNSELGMLRRMGTGERRIDRQN